MCELLWRYRKALCQTPHRLPWRFCIGHLPLGLVLYMGTTVHCGRSCTAQVALAHCSPHCVPFVLGLAGNRGCCCKHCFLGCRAKKKCVIALHVAEVVGRWAHIGAACHSGASHRSEEPRGARAGSSCGVVATRQPCRFIGVCMGDGQHRWPAPALRIEEGTDARPMSRHRGPPTSELLP